MGKHKKHKHGHRSSSSSSSSSDSDDHEYKHLPKHERKKMKKWRKDYKKGKIPAGSIPPWRAPGYAPGPEPEEGETCECCSTSGSSNHDSSEHEEEHEVYKEQKEEEQEEKEEEQNEEEEHEEKKEEHEKKEEEHEEREEEHEEKEEEHEEKEEEHKKGKEEEEEDEESKKKLKKKDKEDDEDKVDRDDAPTPPPEDQMPTVSLDGVAELYHPTVPPHPDFDPEADAEVLRNSMTGSGTEEQAILELISHRSNAQRQEIELTFKTKYGKDLIDDLNSELSGELRETVMALFKPPAFYDAWSLHEAMEGAGTKDAVLIEILCTRSNQQINDLKEAYQENYGRSLEEDITNDTSGYFKRLLVACCQGNRNELNEDQIQMVLSDGPGCVVDRDLAKQDAEKLYAAGEKKFGTDESAFIEVLAVRNFYQLNAMFEEYQQLAGKDILASIDSEMSGHIESGLKAIVRSARNRPEYFAYKLNKAMSRLGTNDGTLIRIIVSRSEIDLADIKVAYETRYGKSLAAAIESDTSGDYRQLLLALLRN